LKSSFNISGFSATNQIILTAMQRYGMLLADNGSSWYISGAPDPRWNNDDLHVLTTLAGTDFEAVDDTTLMVDPNSGEAIQPGGPEPISVSPGSGSGANQTFTFIFSDPNGASDIATANVNFSATLVPHHACYLSYSPSSNSISQAGDAGHWKTPLTIGSPGTAQNSQCTINAGASSVSMSGGKLTLNLALSFSAAFAGAKNIYMDVTNATLDSGWSTKGTWTVPAATPPPPPATPAAVSVTPASGNGSIQIFTFTFTDASGAADIATASLDINARLVANNACYLSYTQSSNTVALASDAGGFPAGLPIGTPGTSANSQCSIDAGASSVTASGNTLTLNLALSFSDGFAGAKNIYMDADGATTDSGWWHRGTWTVP